MVIVALAGALAMAVAGRKMWGPVLRSPGTWRLLEVRLAGATILAIFASLAAPNTKAWQDPILAVLGVLLVTFALAMVRFAVRGFRIIRAQRAKAS